MKKVLISLFLLISTLMLSSCQVNWFGSHFDVPWYFIAVPVFVLFIVLYVIIVSKTYVCPKCKTEFKPKWYQIYITIHFNDSRIAKCPNCGRKGFCKRKDANRKARDFLGFSSFFAVFFDFLKIEFLCE